MKAVLKNDWYSVRYLILILIVISVFSSWLNCVTPEEGCFNRASPLIYAAFLPPALYMMDERVKWGRFAAALPGKRCDYVNSKYISVIFSLIADMTVMTICHFIIKLSIEKNDPIEHLPVLVLGLSASLIMCSILLPITTAFGSKAGIVSFFITITLCGVVAGYYDAMIEDGNASLPDFGQGMIFLGAAAIIYILSWLISVLIYNHREL